MMPSLSNAQLTALHAQHSLQSDDLIRICQLAKVEGIFESIESWHFEQFFGFTLHLFITTESPHTRQQISQLLPKFGSRGVLPMVKIAHHFPATGEPTYDVKTLALKSLGQMAPPSFVIGLQEVLALECADELMPVLIEALVMLTRQHTHESILLLLARLLPEASRRWVERVFHQRLSQSNLDIELEGEISPLKINVVTEKSLVVDKNNLANQPACRPENASLEASVLSLCALH